MQIVTAPLLLAIYALLATATSFQVAHFESHQLGIYHTQNCKSHRRRLLGVFRALHDTLPQVVTDLSSSPSSAAYTTFFKDITYAPYIRSIFNKIKTAAPAVANPNMPASTPLFVCIDDREQVSWGEGSKKVDALDFCSNSHGAPAAALMGTPYIIICPLFFEQPAIPSTSATDCFDIHPRIPHFFAQDGKAMVKYQMWHLMHEMVHYYLVTSKPKNYRDLDVYGVNQCLDLLGSQAVMNPNSYTYYAANIRLGCTKFPTVKTRPSSRGGGTELLEIDGDLIATTRPSSDTEELALLEAWDNKTGAAVNGSVALEVETVSVASASASSTLEPLPTSDPDLTSRSMRKGRLAQ